MGVRARRAAALLLCLPVLMSVVGFRSADPSISLSRSVGPPTTRTVLSGTGFAPSEAISVRFDARGIAKATTDLHGSFSAGITVPGSAQPGDHAVTAKGRTSGLVASALFTVRTDWPMFHFGLDRTGLNPYENTLSPANVSGLSLDWSADLVDAAAVSPAVVGGVVYAGNMTGGLFAFDASTGDLKWSLDVGGYGVSDPAVVEGVVYFGTDINGAVVAADAQTGAILWEVYMGGGVWGTPAVSHNTVYIGSTDGYLYALDAQTGVRRWRSYYVAATEGPAVVDGVVYAGGFDKLYAFDAQTGARLWSTHLEDIVQVTPAVSDGVVYAGTTNFPPWKVYGIDAATGAILWSTEVPGPAISSPAVAGGLVYAASQDGNLYAFDAATGAITWVAPAGGCYSAPAIANGVVYVGSDDDSVYALDASTGPILWSFATQGKACASPAVVNGMVYIGSFDGNLYAFGLPG